MSEKYLTMCDVRVKIIKVSYMYKIHKQTFAFVYIGIS